VVVVVVVVVVVRVTPTRGTNTVSPITLRIERDFPVDS